MTPLAAKSTTSAVYSPSRAARFVDTSDFSKSITATEHGGRNRTFLGEEVPVKEAGAVDRAHLPQNLAHDRRVVRGRRDVRAPRSSVVTTTYPEVAPCAALNESTSVAGHRAPSRAYASRSILNPARALIPPGMCTPRCERWTMSFATHGTPAIVNERRGSH